jgi:hypothetical protein
VWESLSPTGRCAVFFAYHEGVRAAGLFLLIDKHGVQYFAGVSHQDFLPLRVNNFLHWQAICWARNQGLRHYRLGPIFPELPDNWPVSRVSRFKGEFGASSVPLIQGSLFLKPGRYLEDARRAVALRCGVAEDQAVPARPEFGRLTPLRKPRSRFFSWFRPLQRA